MKRNAQFSDGSFFTGMIGGLVLGSALVGGTLYITGASLARTAESIANTVLEPFKPKKEGEEDSTGGENADEKK